MKISRAIHRCEKVEGFVVGLGSSWVLLHSFSGDVSLDGYTLLRLRDIKQVRVRYDEDSFTVRALQKFAKESPRSLKNFDLDSFVGAVQGASRKAKLMAIYVEEVAPDICYIGRVTSVTSSSLLLQEVNPDAWWAMELDRWFARDITRIEFGGRYVRALAHMAGRRPTAKSIDTSWTASELNWLRP